ncbi:MAG: hypothetical protein LBB90_00905 [Tannerella sp.]|jgi:hypothetical protein|nr:hypothetical protein [Tannerella sp.]
MSEHYIPKTPCFTLKKAAEVPLTPIPAGTHPSGQQNQTLPSIHQQKNT